MDEIRERLLLDEYEIKHFGFSSSILLTEFKDALIYTIKSCHEDMEKCIAEKLKLSDEEKTVLHSDINTLTETYAKETTKCLKRNEQNIRNIFSIPRHILLNDDNIHVENASIDEQELLNEIDQLKLEYLKEKSLSLLYEEEIKHIDRTSELQKQISALLKQIHKIPDSNNSVTQFNKLYNLYNDLLHRFDSEYNTNITREQQL